MAFKRGYFIKEEFLAVCLWKSRRPKNLYNSNLPKSIEDVTKKAFLSNDEREKMKILTKLNGISIPSASALLSVCDPENYPIIDVRCVESLQDLKYINWKSIGLNSWIDYLSVLRALAKKYKKSARDIEKGLFAYNRVKLDKIFENLYK